MRQPLFFLHFTCRLLPLTAFPDTRQEAFVTIRPQTKNGGNKDETDIKIYEEQMVASFHGLLYARGCRVYHIHSGNTAHAHGRLYGVHVIHAGDRALEFRITPSDNLM